MSPEHETLSKNVNPLSGRVAIVRDTAESITKAGIVLPESSKGKLNSGTVIAVGIGCEEVIEPGCRVVFSGFGGSEIRIGEDLVLLMDQGDIHARVNTDEKIAEVK